MSDTTSAFQLIDEALDQINRPEWEERSHLAEVLRVQGLLYEQVKTTEARELLAPVYDWFTKGFDTKDLKEAKTLLDQLA